MTHRVLVCVRPGQGLLIKTGATPAEVVLPQDGTGHQPALSGVHWSSTSGKRRLQPRARKEHYEYGAESRNHLLRSTVFPETRTL